MEQKKTKGIFQIMVDYEKAHPPTRYITDITLDELKELVNSIYETPREYRGTTICGRMVVTDDKPIGIVTCILDECSVCKEFNELLKKIM